LSRDAVVGLECVPFSEPGDEQHATVFEARRFQFDDERFVHSDRLHQGYVVEMALHAHGLRRQVELIAERAGEGFVRGIAGIERHGQDIGGAGGETSCGLGQAPAAHVAHHRPTGRLAEGTQ
jgi:hypothetical protein